MSGRTTKSKVKLRKGEYLRDNNTFEYKWSDRRGKRHSVYAKTISELRVKEEEIIKSILDGIDYSKLEATVNSYFELWKELKTGIRETTFAGYVRYYERYVQPEFGNLKLKDVSYSTVVLFFKKMARERGLCFSTIQKIEVTLSMILDVAVRDEIIRSNPCKGALRELQREIGDEQKVVCPLSLSEQKQLEDFLAKPGRFNKYYPVFTVMLWTGMRVGEVLGLRWDDIDFDKGIINVNHTLMHYDKGKGRGSAYKINPPKTKSSQRTVPMLPKVKNALLREKEYQKLIGIKCNVEIDGYTNFVFVNSNGNVYHHKKLNYLLNQICEAINEEIHAEDPRAKDFPHVHNHMLRHTFATRMREAGADIKATSDMMGHEGIMITLKTYTDASDEFKMREISVLDDYYGNAI